MKKILFLLMLGIVCGCNNTGTTATPNDLDRTDNDDTAVVIRDSLPASNRIDSFTKDSGTINRH